MKARKTPTTLLDIALEGLRNNSETLRVIDENIETATRRHVEGELNQFQMKAAIRHYERHHKVATRKRLYYLELIEIALQDEPIDISAPDLMQLLDRGEQLINKEERIIQEREEDPDWLKITEENTVTRDSVNMEEVLRKEHNNAPSAPPS